MIIVIGNNLSVVVDYGNAIIQNLIETSVYGIIVHGNLKSALVLKMVV